MSARIAPRPHEDVKLDDRGAMTPARKARIWESRGGKCWFCNFEVLQSGPDVRYDHRLPLELGGADDDANIWPLHREPCDRIKTAADARRIADMRRQEKLRLDNPRTVSANPIRSRGFDEPRRKPAKSKRGSA